MYFKLKQKHTNMYYKYFQIEIFKYLAMIQITKNFYFQIEIYIFVIYFLMCARSF